MIHRDHWKAAPGLPGGMSSQLEFSKFLGPWKQILCFKFLNLRWLSNISSVLCCLKCRSCSVHCRCVTEDLCFFCDLHKLFSLKNPAELQALSPFEKSRQGQKSKFSDFCSHITIGKSHIGELEKLHFYHFSTHPFFRGRVSEEENNLKLVFYLTTAFF